MCKGDKSAAIGLAGAALVLGAWTLGMAMASPAKVEGEAARPARLLGQCKGVMLAAMQEDDFPKGCDWIEPIRYADDGVTVWRDDTMP